jgi:hypothetical protein
MRALAVIVQVMWGAQIVSTMVALIKSLGTPDVPDDAWFFLALHIGIALVGVWSGVLLFRGSSLWKWPALGSSLILLMIVDYTWFTLPSKHGFGWWDFVTRFPRLSFSVFVMPVFAAIVAVIAVLRLAAGKRVASVGGV